MSEEEFIKQQMAKMDTNHDGKLSQDEYLAPTKDLFARMDTNHDGFLTVSEVMAARTERMAAMAKAREEAMRIREQQETQLAHQGTTAPK